MVPRLYPLRLAALALFVTTVAAQPQVSIDSTVGECAVRRAGRSAWEAAGAGARLYDNDVIRVGKRGHARLAWGGEGTVWLHENSQLLVNLHGDGARQTELKHATVFFGAAFFMIRHLVPRAIAPRRLTRIYTPTAAISIRGTAFEVRVERGTGATRVSVIAGTVLVGNIIRDESLFLSAAHTTTVSLNADPPAAGALLDTYIDTLKGWVPGAVIEGEMRKENAEARAARAAVHKEPDRGLLVVPLVNESMYRGSWDIGTGMAAMLAGAVKAQTGASCSTAAAVPSDLLAAGQAAGKRFVLAGEIRRFEILQSARITVPADTYLERATARINLNLQLIDSRSRRLVLERDIAGEATDALSTATSWKAIAAMKFDLDDEKFAGSILGRALSAALEDAAAEVGRYVGRGGKNE